MMGTLLQECILDGEHLEQRFRDAGFVDIQVIKETWDVGNWREGDASSPEMSDMDPVARVRQVALDVCANHIMGAMPALAGFFRDEEESNEFGQRVVEELRTQNLHLTSTT